MGIMKLRTGEPWMPAPDYGRSLKPLTIHLLVRAIDTALQYRPWIRHNPSSSSLHAHQGVAYCDSISDDL